MAMFNLGKFLEEFQDLAIALVVVGIVIAFGASFLADQEQSAANCDDGFTYNQSQELCVNDSNSSDTADAGTGVDAVNSAQTGINDLASGITDVTGIAVIVVVLAMLFILSQMNNKQ